MQRFVMMEQELGSGGVSKASEIDRKIQSTHSHTSPFQRGGPGRREAGMKFESEIHVGRFLGIKGEVKMFAFLGAVNDTDNDFFHLDEETRPDQQKDKDKH